MKLLPTFTTWSKSLSAEGLAYKAGRYDDVVAILRKKALTKATLSTQERVLLSKAYSNLIDKRRWTLQSLCKIVVSDKLKTDAIRYTATGIRYELDLILEDVLELLNFLLDSPSVATDFEAKIFYNIKAADYYRYMSEYAQGETLENAINNASNYYETANALAKDTLTPAHPVRLYLAVNSAVFYFEIMNFPYRAYNISRMAFDDAWNYARNIGTASSSIRRSGPTLEFDKTMAVLSKNIRIYETEISRQEKDRHDVDWFWEDMILNKLYSRGTIAHY